MKLEVVVEVSVVTMLLQLLLLLLLLFEAWWTEVLLQWGSHSAFSRLALITIKFEKRKTKQAI